MSYRVTADTNTIRLNETDTVRSVLQNIVIILNTWRGSVPMYREFGISQEIMHRPLPVARTMLRAEIEEAVETFEPRAKVIDVLFLEDQRTMGGLIPTVEVEIYES